MYQLFLIHKNEGKLATAIRGQVLKDLRALRCNSDVLAIRENDCSITADTISVGLFIGNVEGASDANCISQVERLVANSVPVVPLKKTGADFHSVVPKILHPINVLDDGSLENISAVLLRLLGLTEKHRRVFVSYRRADSSEMGEQVWEVLSKAGFDVFLDRFCVEPGANFQDRLTEQLGDKSFLLLIESPGVADSEWVNYEIDFARKNRMGLLALTWPQTVCMKRTIAGLYDKYRILLRRNDLQNAGSQGKLVGAFLSKLADFVEQAHAKAMLRRRRQLMSSLESELCRNGISYKLISDWSLVAETHSIRSAGDQIVSITPRPPEIPDLFVLDNHCGVYAAELETGILIHTAASLRSERKELLEWAIAKRKLAVVNEDQIVDLVESFLKKGRNP